jgi:uncharacterized protein
MQKECENNVILAICNRFLNKPIDPDKLILIAAFEKSGIIISCAVTTLNKTALATFSTKPDVAVKPLASYFNRNQINLKGLSGGTAAVNSFMEVYQKPIIQSTTLLLYSIMALQSIELVSNSELILATTLDLPLLKAWLKNFQMDAGLLPLKPDEEIQAATEDKIGKKVLYKLVVSGNQQPVSMLAVVRETKNVAIISWVYTPPYSRSKGFASTAVYKLTELMHKNHQKRCALFADKSNPVSNKIYQNIGYDLVAEYLDIDF